MADLSSDVIARTLVCLLCACSTRGAPERLPTPVLAAIEPPGTPTDPVSPTDTSPPTPDTAPVLALVGERTEEPFLALALRAAGLLGATFPDDLVSTSDPAVLVTAARARGLLGAEAVPGALVVFEDGGLVGAVTSVASDGVVEIVYLYGGVVRRGFVYAAEPSTRRDADGNVRNTFVRKFHAKDQSDQLYLAGELLTGYIAPGKR